MRNIPTIAGACMRTASLARAPERKSWAARTAPPPTNNGHGSWYAMAVRTGSIPIGRRVPVPGSRSGALRAEATIPSETRRAVQPRSKGEMKAIRTAARLNTRGKIADESHRDARARSCAEFGVLRNTFTPALPAALLAAFYRPRSRSRDAFSRPSPTRPRLKKEYSILQTRLLWTILYPKGLLVLLSLYSS